MYEVIRLYLFPAPNGLGDARFISYVPSTLVTQVERRVWIAPRQYCIPPEAHREWLYTGVCKTDIPVKRPIVADDMSYAIPFLLSVNFRELSNPLPPRPSSLRSELPKPPNHLRSRPV